MRHVPPGPVHCQKQPSPVQTELACDSVPSASSPGPAEGSDSWSEASLLPPTTTRKRAVSECRGCILIPALNSSSVLSISSSTPPCCVCTDSASSHFPPSALTAAVEVQFGWWRNWRTSRLSTQWCHLLNPCWQALALQGKGYRSCASVLAQTGAIPEANCKSVRHTDIKAR